MGRNILIYITLLVFIIFQSVEAQHNTELFLQDFGNDQLKKLVEKQISEFLTELNYACFENREPAFNEQYVKESANISVKSLWQTAHFKCSETEIIELLVKQPNGGYEVRNISLMIMLSPDSVHYEDAVILLTPSGNIEDLYFGIETHQYKKLLRERVSVADFRRRQIILDFVENFRTAYNRKDVIFIDHVFSDNALVIVGRVIKVDPDGEDYLSKNFEKQKVELIRYNKSEYIKHLKGVFARNQYIKIGFDDIDITQHRLHNDIYGVTLKQHWRSSTYSDKGYLFLMIDFKNEDNPKIHVRAWQPEEFTSPDSVISLGDFEIIQ